MYTPALGAQSWNGNGSNFSFCYNYASSEGLLWALWALQWLSERVLPHHLFGIRFALHRTRQVVVVVPLLINKTISRSLAAAVQMK